MSGHTPGPWFVTYTRNGTANVGPSHNCTVAALLMAPVGEMEANARLIASAPMLLDALQRALRDSGCDGDLCTHFWHDQARAAIDAATGENA